MNFDHERFLDIALLVLRIAFGLIFLIYGYRHVVGLEGFIVAFDEGFQIPLPQITAPLAAWAEFLAGIGALLGVLTRLSGLSMMITMAVSTLAVRLPEGLASEEKRDFLGLSGHWDFDLALFAIGCALLLLGPGRAAISHLIFKGERNLLE